MMALALILIPDLTYLVQSVSYLLAGLMLGAAGGALAAQKLPPRPGGRP